MPTEPAVIIVGSGPAGVSAAFPLVRSGVRVLMLDGGLSDETTVPAIPGSLRELRRHPDHWKLLVGEEYQRFNDQNPLSSPKFHSPAYAYVFRDYLKRYAIDTQDFALVGSLASGGLSNAWGAGVGRLDDRDLEDYPISAHDLQPSYRRISQRIGISGCNDDDMAETHGREDFLLPPIDPCGNLSILYRRYRARRSRALARGVRLGRTRIATLTSARADRGGCVYCGRCLFGCPQRSIWSAAYDLESLKTHPAFSYRGGYFVRRLVRRETGYDLVADSLGEERSARFSAGKVILACGAFGSARLVLDALEWHGSISFQSSPMATFGLLLPRWRWAALEDERATSQTQLNFRVDDAGLAGRYAFGYLFQSDGLPAGDLIRTMPFSWPQSRKLARLMQPAVFIGACWLNGGYSRHELGIRASDGTVQLRGGHSPATAQDVGRVMRRLGSAMLRYGVFLIPGSVQLAPPGEDLHYGGTVPMRSSPRAHQADATGEVRGLPDVYVVDGAALTSIPAKPHTFTIMANADRIAHILAARLSGAGRAVPS